MPFKIKDDFLMRRYIKSASTINLSDNTQPVSDSDEFDLIKHVSSKKEPELIQSRDKLPPSSVISERSSSEVYNQQRFFSANQTESKQPDLAQIPQNIRNRN